MNKFFVPVLLFMVNLGGLFAQTTAGLYEMKVGEELVLSTVETLKLPVSFGPDDHAYAVVRVFGLQPGSDYCATVVYDGGTRTYYSEFWVDGNPFQAGWRTLGGVGSGTGEETPMPGYETYHLFTTDAKSTRGSIYFIVRSNKPWKITVNVTPGSSGVTWLTRNRYGYFAVNDWTCDDSVTFLLSKD